MLEDPLVQTAALPLATSVAAAGALHLGAGPVRGRMLAAAGIGAAFLAGYAVIVGLPAFPPPSSMGRLFWSAAAGIVLGALLDVLKIEGRAATLAVAGWLAAALLWVVLPALGGLPGAVAVVLLGGAGWLAFSRDASRDDGAAAPGITLLAGAVAVGGVALVGSSASVAQLAFALAAGTGGFLLWNWPVQRHAWTASGRAALGVLVLLAATLAFFSSAHAEALLAVLPALFAERLRDRLPLPATPAGRAAGTVALGVLSLLPALASVAIAVLLAGTGEASGY